KLINRPSADIAVCFIHQLPAFSWPAFKATGSFSSEARSFPGNQDRLMITAKIKLQPAFDFKKLFIGQSQKSIYD
ncbi:MAG TPA: hypothetical protein DCW97_03055, partial [Acidobacteria bacterium]|nr:hypothetical protein [Acidobacteriota bacterium]